MTWTLVLQIFVLAIIGTAALSIIIATYWNSKFNR